jgi:hypothetical protein
VTFFFLKQSLTTQHRQTWNLLCSPDWPLLNDPCLFLQNGGITGIGHQTQLDAFKFEEKVFDDLDSS